MGYSKLEPMLFGVREKAYHDDFWSYNERTRLRGMICGWQGKIAIEEEVV